MSENMILFREILCIYGMAMLAMLSLYLMTEMLNKLSGNLIVKKITKTAYEKGVYYYLIAFSALSMVGIGAFLLYLSIGIYNIYKIYESIHSI